MMHRKLEDYNKDCHLMHHKVDQISSCLGITVYCPGMEQELGGGSNRHVGGRGMKRDGVGPPQSRDDSVQTVGFPYFDPLP